MKKCACGQLDENPRAYHGMKTCWIWNHGTVSDIEELGLDWKRQAELAGALRPTDRKTNAVEPEMGERYGYVPHELQCHYGKGCLYWDTQTPHTWCIPKTSCFFAWSYIRENPALLLRQTKWYIIKKWQVFRWWLAHNIEQWAYRNSPRIINRDNAWRVHLAWSIRGILILPEYDDKKEGF
jgi:hypothetical protein